jgi:hypothetical protein
MLRLLDALAPVAIVGGVMACTVDQQQQKWESVHAAVAYRDIEGVRALLASGARPDERDETGQTPLIYAASSDQFRIAELLLQYGADPFAFDRFGVTAAEFLANSREPNETPDGQARLRVVSMMQAAGVPVPPPPRPEVLRLAAAGQWKQGRKMR